jgi:hypothetical protein
MRMKEDKEEKVRMLSPCHVTELAAEKVGLRK